MKMAADFSAWLRNSTASVFIYEPAIGITSIEIAATPIPSALVFGQRLSHNIDAPRYRLAAAAAIYP